MLEKILLGLKSNDIELCKESLRLISAGQVFSFNDAKAIFDELVHLHKSEDLQVQMLCRSAIGKLSGDFPNQFNVDFLFQVKEKAVSAKFSSPQKPLEPQHEVLSSHSNASAPSNTSNGFQSKPSKTIYWVLICGLILWGLSFGYTNHQSNKTALEAKQRVLSSMKKIESAIGLGVNLMQFNELVIAAKIAVDQDIEKLTQKDRGEIEAAFKIFNDARTLWQAKISILSKLNYSPASNQELFWYEPVPKQLFDFYLAKFGKPSKDISPDEALQFLFSLGLSHVKKVAES